VSSFFPARVLAVLLGVASLWHGQAGRAGEAAPLETQFATPPGQVRPWVWYRWQGPVTRQGLEADLDAISGAGFGGFVLDFSDGQPLKEAKLGHGPEFGGKEFFDLIFTTLEGARKRGLEVSIMPQNGWASAGGHWIAPEDQEQALVWSEEFVQGPGKMQRKLLPPLREGAFYRDIAVLAFPVDRIPTPTRFRQNPPAVTADLEAAEAPAGYWKADPQALVDGQPGSLISLRPPRGGRPSSVVLTFQEPFAADRLYLHPGPSYINHLSGGRFVLEVSEDGQKFRRVHEFSYDPDRDNGTGGFLMDLPARTTARVWRLQLTDLKHPMHAWLADIELLGKDEKPSVLPRIPFGDARAGGAASVPEGVLASVWSDAESTRTRSDGVLNLSKLLQPDGSISWDAPAGSWVVARIGATVSGETTSAVGQFRSPPNWEANKLSAAAAKAFLSGFFDRLVNDPRAKPYLGQTLVGLHLDSWECSHHLWSEAVRRAWKERMPYDLEKWLPALLGFTVDSPELTRRFLWDYRRLIADLSGDEFMRAIRDRAHEVGLYLETEFPTRDRFKTFEYTDVPITEFSPKGDDGRAGLLKEGIQEGAKMTSSAAHLYGLPVTSSEAFLAREKTIKPDHLSPVLGRRDDGIRKFDRDPYALKSSADKVFAQGVNHLIFHLFLHQPFLDKKPGLTTVYGTNFGRDLIWWPMAGPWVDYLTRCQFLLRQGVPQADFLFCLSEDALPHTKVKALTSPPYGFTLASGYDFDFCTGQNVINLCSVKDGKIVLPSGMTYELLVLGDLGGEITWPLLRKVAELVEQGANVLAAPAARSPSLADQVSGQDEKLRERAAAMWGPIDGKNVKEHAYGKGRVLWGYTVPEALRHLKVAPAFTSSVPSVEFAHRRVGEDDIFFLTSQSDQAVTAQCRFRATGAAVEWWHPDTGRIEPARGTRSDANGTEMTIDFPPNGSLFVVFRPRASSTAAAPLALTGEIRTIPGPWQVGFSSPFGETAELSFEKLIPWPEHADPFVKTFSGAATYRADFEVTGAGGGGVLDLGGVWNLARVTVNGTSFPPLWKPPYRVDISRALVEGKNRLEIEVRNTWVNRLIGDLNLSKAERKSWININPHQANSPLRPAGLLGPVRLERASADRAAAP
jgi:hypothetical protein